MFSVKSHYGYKHMFHSVSLFLFAVFRQPKLNEKGYNGGFKLVPPGIPTPQSRYEYNIVPLTQRLLV